MRNLYFIVQSVMKLLPIEVQVRLLAQWDMCQINRTNQYYFCSFVQGGLHHD